MLGRLVDYPLATSRPKPYRDSSNWLESQKVVVPVEVVDVWFTVLPRPQTVAPADPESQPLFSGCVTMRSLGPTTAQVWPNARPRETGGGAGSGAVDYPMGSIP